MATNKLHITFTYFAIVCFGLSSWITINGVYSQLPILMRELPEQYSLATYMSVALQCANIFPFCHFLLSLCIPMKKKHIIDSISACLLILLGIAGLILMALFWNRTIDSGQHKVSLFFFLLVFFNGAVDCCSTVIYFPWIKHYPKLYTSALTVGEGLTGGIAGILALIQQPGSDNPLFSVSVMCYILAGLMVLSWVSFMCVWLLPCGRAQVLQQQESEQQQVKIQAAEEEEQQELVQPVTQAKQQWIHNSTIRLILVQATISFLDNGILVALGPYVFKSYPYASQLLSYGLTLSLIVDPIACFVAYWICFKNYALLWAVHAVWLVGMLVQITIGFLHNNPPLKESLAFGIALVAIKVISRALLSFGKTTEFLKVHESKTAYDPFRLAGLAIQVSALVGSLIMLFVLKD